MGDSNALGNTTAKHGASSLEPIPAKVMLNVTLHLVGPKVS